MDFEWLWYISVDSSAVSSIPLWWRMLIMGKAMHVWRQEINGKPLYLPLSFAVNLKHLYKIYIYFQKKFSSWNRDLFFFSLSSVFKKILLRVVYQGILLNTQLLSNRGCFQLVLPPNLHRGQLTAYFSFIYFSTAQITNDSVYAWGW